MKIRRLLFLNVVALAALGAAGPAIAAPFEDWQYRHAVPVEAPGLIEIEVPPQALDAAREDMVDLRIAGADGVEIPYIRVLSESGAVVDAPDFTATLAPGKTLLEIETPGERPVEAVILESPANRFLKAVRVEASDDGQDWILLAEGAPVFRELHGAEQMRVSFEPSAATRLRLTIDDSQTEAIPFSGARLRLAPDSPIDSESTGVTILARSEAPGRTRLEIDFGAAHLSLTSIGIEADDPLFMRGLALLAPSVEGAELREKRLAAGTVFRVAIDGATPKSELDVPIETKTPARQLTLLVENGDSPPLQITAVRASRRIVRVRFLAGKAGEFALFAGNPNAAQPAYDVAALARGLRGANVIRADVGARAENPAYAAAALLPEIPLAGAALDTAAWGYRKAVTLAAAGIQQLELDARVLSRSGTRGNDWRLLRDGHQVPFIVQRTSISRSMVPKVTEHADPKRPSVSRWALEFPHDALPVSTLVCRTDATLFDRKVTLIEETKDNYGQKRSRTLGRARWIRKSEAPDANLRLELSLRPETDRWFLEIENGDNAPIALRDFAVFHPAVRLLFKAGDAAGLDLYYGNRESAPPNYDLGLVASQLFRAARSTATLGEEETLEAAGEGPRPISGKPGIILWIVLAAVVGGLLFLIARLLPKISGG